MQTYLLLRRSGFLLRSLLRAGFPSKFPLLLRLCLGFPSEVSLRFRPDYRICVGFGFSGRLRLGGIAVNTSANVNDDQKSKRMAHLRTLKLF